jgi:hypothetical protein
VLCVLLQLVDGNPIPCAVPLSGRIMGAAPPSFGMVYANSLRCNQLQSDRLI